MANEQNNGSMQMQNGMGNGSTGDYGNGMMRSMLGRSAMRASSVMQGGMGEESSSERRRAKKEYRAKMKRYKEKHEQAKAVFQQITGKSPETRMEAIELNAQIQSRGTPMERSRAQFAVADFCWACDEKEAEKEVREEVDDFDSDEDRELQAK